MEKRITKNKKIINRLKYGPALTELFGRHLVRDNGREPLPCPINHADGLCGDFRRGHRGHCRGYPWWNPQYFIPLAGMVLGNSMTALGLSLDRLFSDLKVKREQVGNYNLNHCGNAFSVFLGCLDAPFDPACL